MFAWHDAYLAPVVVLGAAALAYCVFFYWGSADFIGPRLNEDDPDKRQSRAIVLQRWIGTGILGVTAIVAGLVSGYDPMDLGLKPGHEWWPTVALIGGVGVVLVPLITLSARKESQWAFYPQIRTKTWSSALMRNNILSWSAYLVAYELLFRGLLLYPLVDAFGTWPGLAAMTAIYAVVHLPKASPGETIGTFPIGILFGCVALASGSIIGPVVAHIMIALTNDLATIRFNPDIKTSSL